MKLKKLHIVGIEITDGLATVKYRKDKINIIKTYAV